MCADLRCAACSAGSDDAEQSGTAHNGGSEIKVVGSEGSVTHPKHDLTPTAKNVESTTLNSTAQGSIDSASS